VFDACDKFAVALFRDVLMTWHKPLAFGLAAILTAFASLSLTPPIAAEPAARTSLAGQLLVATPSMTDPRFDRAVILMVKHDSQGAFGIVINRPVGEHAWSELLGMFGEKDVTVPGKVRVFVGGPVQLELAFVIHSADYGRPGTVDIDGRVAMTSNREILRDIANNNGPKKSLVAFGYAGWGPGQLEGEMARRVWSTTPADTALIFDEEREKVWDSAYARRGQDL
jgi:putative transcriptional regulator